LSTIARARCWIAGEALQWVGGLMMKLLVQQYC